MANYITKVAIFFHVFLIGVHCSLQRCLPMPYLNLCDRVQSILVGRMGTQSTFIRSWGFSMDSTLNNLDQYCHISSSCFWVPFAYGHFRHRSTHMYPSNKHESLNKLRILMGLGKARFDWSPARTIQTCWQHKSMAYKRVMQATHYFHGD